MLSKIYVLIIFTPLFLFFCFMLYLEVSMFSLLPHEQGGMSFWIEFKHVWYRSISFYGLVVILSLLFYLIIKWIKDKKEN